MTFVLKHFKKEIGSTHTFTKVIKLTYHENDLSKLNNEEIDKNTFSIKLHIILL